MKWQHMTRLSNWYARAYGTYPPLPRRRSALTAAYQQRQRNRRKRRR